MRESSTRLWPERRSRLRRSATAARTAAMSDSCPVQWTGRRTIVTLPQLDRVISIYSSLEAAIAAAVPKAVPVRPQPGIQHAAPARQPVGSAERSDRGVGR